MLNFFFKQKTAYEMRISDWSSDVCSSDLAARAHQRQRETPEVRIGIGVKPHLLRQSLRVKSPALGKGGNAREAAELGKALHLVRDAGFDMMAGDRLVIKRRGELVARLRLHVGEVDVEDARRRPVLRRVAAIGRAPWWVRVGKYVWIHGAAVPLKKQN